MNKVSFVNRLPTEKRVAVVKALVEGNSIASTTRMLDVSKPAVLKLLVDLGQVCSTVQDRLFRNLTCRRLELDEIWSFVGCKAKNVPTERHGQFGIGDVWTWTALDAETKLVPSFLVGPRDAESARLFVEDLASRLANRVQITTDGLAVYVAAVENALGADVDFAQLVKIYGGTDEQEKRYSPAECRGARKTAITGEPSPRHISTSFVERQYLTMRMSMRRFTRLTNAFSKKVENHAAAVALNFAYYNLCRIHSTIRVSPAMAAGAVSRLWSVADLVKLLPDEQEPRNLLQPIRR